MDVVLGGASSAGSSLGQLVSDSEPEFTVLGGSGGLALGGLRGCRCGCSRIGAIPRSRGGGSLSISVSFRETMSLRWRGRLGRVGSWNNGMAS